MITSVVTAAMLGQLSVGSGFDDGAIVGRVCEDRDADGQCAPDEPGLGGVRVWLETGLVAITDREGRYHLAGVRGRAPDASQGGRFLPGRHRLGVDSVWLVPGARVTPAATTIDVPMGALVLQDFAVTVDQPRATQLRLVGPPTLSGRPLRWKSALAGAEGARVAVDGVAMLEGAIEATLHDGENVLLVTVVREPVLECFTLSLDVVARQSSTLVVPRALERCGQVVVDAMGELHSTIPAQTVTVSRGADDQVKLRTPAGSWVERVQRPRPRRLFALGLLELEASFDPLKAQFHVAGRGAGLARAQLGPFALGAELDLRDTDVEAVQATPVALLEARSVGVFERQLEVARVVPIYGDQSSTIASNPADGRFRVELSHPEWGRVGFGSTRFALLDSEVGRAHRAVQAAFLELHTPTRLPLGIELQAVAAPSQLDVTSGLARAEAHEQFGSTGGSLFFLRHAAVVQGSEVVRVEWRDSLTGLVVRDLRLTRLVDYSLDAVAGQVLLARPLSFLAAESPLQTDPLTSAISATLVVDYEYLSADVAGSVLGAQLRGRAGPVRLGLAALHDGGWSILRGTANAALGPVALSFELARSEGAVAGLSTSFDGGLTAQGPTSNASHGWAATARARSVGLFNAGSWDLSARFRDSGFEDLGGLGRAKQLSLRGAQPLGPFALTVVADLRDTPDPRDPLSGQRVAGRVLGLGFGLERDGWGLRLEVRDLFQERTDAAGQVDGGRGGLSVGLAGRYRLTPWLQLRASYRHRLLEYAGAFDDTFASLGADVSPVSWVTVGVRAGWGPQTGVVGWGTLSATRGTETWYGAHSLDVDSAAAGERRLVTGVRQQLDASSAVYVEDVSATDVNGLRQARAVGLSQTVFTGLTISARYERGARATDGIRGDVARDAGGLTVAWEADRFRLFARGEVRVEQGGVEQWLVTAGGDVALTPTLSALARLQLLHTSQSALLTQRSLDTVAAVAWRPGPVALVLRYTFHRLLQHDAEQLQHVLSLLPAVQLGDRFSLAAGAHLALGSIGAIASASVRPSVRVIAGVEVAAEGALRTSAPDGGQLTALRGEIGYRFDHRFFLGGGYSFFGFSGTGLDAGAAGANNRVYVRTELAW